MKAHGTRAWCASTLAAMRTNEGPIAVASFAELSAALGRCTRANAVSEGPQTQ